MFIFYLSLSNTEFASWQNIHAYLKKYVNLFHITERIRFQTRVLTIEKEDMKNDTIPWIIQVESNSGQHETFQFDLVVIATGIHSQPFIPEFPGQNKFRGQILCPSSIKTPKQVENKRILIIGGGKCATDLAVFAGRFARSCHLVFRKAHWMVPRTVMNGRLPIRYLCTRAASVLFSPFPTAPHSAFFRFLHRTFPNFFLKLINMISADIMRSHGSDLYGDKIFIPQHSFRNENNHSIIPNDFIRLKKEGRIIGKLGTVLEIIDATTVRLDSGEDLQVDTIICATGFVQSFPFFTDKQIQMLGFVKTPVSSVSNGNVITHLYRRIVPTGIPNIGFIGFGGSVYHWMITEVSSHWLSDYFLKRLALPSEREMLEEIKVVRDFLRSIFAVSQYEFMYYSIEPIEIYLQDMGLALHRTNNWIREYFGLYQPARLKDLHEERQLREKTGRTPRRWYFSFTHTIIISLILILSFIYFLK